MPLTLMITSYEDSVLALADDDGNLSPADARRMLADHGFTMADVYFNRVGISWAQLDARNAEALLSWLGY